MEDGKIHYAQNLGKHPESGVYMYRFSYRGRVRAGSTGCYRLQEARDYVNALKGRLSLEGVGFKKQKVLSFRQLFEIWMKERAPQRTAKYVKTLKGLITAHALPILGGIQVCDIDKTAINTVLNLYLAKNHKASGANTLALHIGALLGFAVETGRVKERPVTPMVSVQKKPRPIVPKDALDAFLVAVDKQNNLHASFLVRAQLLMGMRNHEARLMRWSGLRLNQKVYIPDKTKNGDAPLMPIPEVMLPWFEKLKQKGDTFGLICPGKTGKPRGHDFTDRYIERALVEAGLPEGITNHRLRASFANALNSSGVPLPTIQKLMRHSKIETTMVYLEVREDEMRTAINLVGETRHAETVCPTPGWDRSTGNFPRPGMTDSLTGKPSEGSSESPGIATLAV